MDCNEFKSLISDALDGILEPAKRDAFAEHRKQCRDCEREFLKQRRIKLYLRSFPTVHEVHEAFRRELIERLRSQRFRPYLRLRTSAVVGTLTIFALLLIGILFGIKVYHRYLFQEEIFIARFDRVTQPTEPYSQANGGRQIGFPLETKGSAYVVNLSQLRPEEFVIRMLARYQKGEVSDELARSVLVDTGLLEGVRLQWLERGALQQLTGQPLRAEIIFPRPLPDQLLVTLTKTSLIELRSFALDAVYAFGIYVPQLETDTASRIPSLHPANEGTGLVYLLSSEFREAEVPEDTPLATIIAFARTPASKESQAASTGS